MHTTLQKGYAAGTMLRIAVVTILNFYKEKELIN